MAFHLKKNPSYGFAYLFHVLIFFFLHTLSFYIRYKSEILKIGLTWIQNP